MEKIDGKSLDIREDSIEKLKQLFPEIITEGEQINFEKLKAILTDDLDESDEKYTFTWNGKSEAMRIANSPTTGTLKPIISKSKDWDNTENLYIEGDNLEVLKLLQKSYSNKIKVIYIDPPYNTGNDFVYKDNFSDNLDNYYQQTGQVNEEGQKLSTNMESNGRFHSDWLNMMYPRLKLARNLLSEDGVIFISIDDNEQHNLRKICDELFGEKNFIANIAHKNRDGVSNDKIISSNHNFILFYAKNIKKIEENRKDYGILRTEEDFKSYNKDDNDGKGPYTLNPVTGPGGARKGNPYYSVLGVKNYWRYGEERMKKLVQEGKVIRINDSIYQKNYKSEMIGKKKGGTTWWDKVGTTSQGTREIKKLFDNNTVFDFPKPETLIEYIINYIDNSDKSYTVLDFFSGSSSTAAATMNVNSKDNGNRKYIMVQLPEPTPPTSVAYENGYENITDVAIDRIKRSGDKLIEENPDLDNELDIGLKYFKLDKSNIKKWNIDEDNLEEELLLFTDNFEEDSTHDDIVYELLLKQGIELTVPIVKESFEKTSIYIVANGAMFVVIGNNIDESIGEYIRDYESIFNQDEDSEIVVAFQDIGFEDDSAKLNTFEILKAAGFKDENIFTI